MTSSLEANWKNTEATFCIFANAKDFIDSPPSFEIPSSVSIKIANRLAARRTILGDVLTN